LLVERVRIHRVVRILPLDLKSVLRVCGFKLMHTKSNWHPLVELGVSAHIPHILGAERMLLVKLLPISTSTCIAISILDRPRHTGHSSIVSFVGLGKVTEELSSASGTFMPLLELFLDDAGHSLIESVDLLLLEVGTSLGAVLSIQLLRSGKLIRLILKHVLLTKEDDCLLLLLAAFFLGA